MNGVSETTPTEPLVVSAGAVTMTVAPALGGRILGFSLEGQNILLEAEAVAGTENANNFGSTFWPSPQSAWGWPPVAAIDRAPYQVAREPGQLVLTSAVGQLLDGSRIALTKTFTPIAAQSAVDVTYVMTNLGGAPVSLAGWQIARVRAGGLTFFGLGEGGVIGDKLCTVTQGGTQWYQYDAAVVTAQGQKTFADGQGWLAHVDGDKILVQSFPDVASGAAAVGEAEIELYADPSHTYVEIEPQGPIKTIEPGASSDPWTVRWWLRRLPLEIAPHRGRADLVAFVETLIRS